jgi:hypothetical protein
MAKRVEASTSEQLQKLMIIQLGLAGIPQRQIRDIVGGDLNNVTAIVKLLKRKESK